ncbi:hypothetical protein SAMN04487969_104244 [Paenibacillus algorifonticola]|uniref:Uncharacterized protein n=1 Tax=Paenibacillus algorifonticola TaxID=684063 RepID=A0A1I2C348_9BACL|nr:hypothetical protein [Paenibacillus algorifonticola]SFE62759.1 hypothetical protein SAMN04487969_104244 [Paenibacillus algorifonticola]
MDKLKNSGFYKLKFFITPEEFKSILMLFEHKQVQFHRTDYAQTKHDYDQVYAAYEAFYQYFTEEEKRIDYHPFFVYSISVSTGHERSVFFIRNEGIPFPYYGQWSEDAFFNEVTNDIKKMTKPLRFSAHAATGAGLQEQKPPVRISKNAMTDLVNSWIFRKYKLIMNGK